MTALSKPSPAGEPDAAVAIREARADDFPAIQEIYAFHVSHGLGSFEEAVVDLAEMTRRWRDIRERGLPYLVAEADGRVLGYAYAGAFRPRSAYRYTVEDSIYVSPQAQRRRVGSRLLAALIERCTALGYRQMVAVIGDSGNLPSINLHLQQGFSQSALLGSVGYKFGRWVDLVIMQRPLGEGSATLPAKG